MRRLLAVVLVVVAGCSSSVDESPIETSTTPSTTPRPSAEQAELIESEVAVIYPGVPAEKAADWARSTCQRILAGEADEVLVDYVRQLFAGGDRPDPTVEQAEAILKVIERSGFCVG